MANRTFSYSRFLNGIGELVLPAYEAISRRADSSVGCEKGGDDRKGSTSFELSAYTGAGEAPAPVLLSAE